MFIDDFDTDSGYESGSEPFTLANGLLISPAFSEHTVPVIISLIIIIKRHFTSTLAIFYARKV